jgi:hypothetical protein
LAAQAAPGCKKEFIESQSPLWIQEWTKKFDKVSSQIVAH